MIALGAATSIVTRHLAAASGFYDDPITRESGCADELGPRVWESERRAAIAELTATGWSVRTLLDSLERRVAPKWLYDSCIDAFLTNSGDDPPPDRSLGEAMLWVLVADVRRLPSPTTTISPHSRPSPRWTVGWRPRRSRT